jgi:hypothetical protein
MWSNNSTTYNDVSWWPWRKNTNSSQDASTSNHCVLKRKNEDGYFTTLCDSKNKNSFICQASTLPKVAVVSNLAESTVNLKCGPTEEIIKDYERALSSLKTRTHFQTIGSNTDLIDLVDTPAFVDVEEKLSINKILVPQFASAAPSFKPIQTVAPKFEPVSTRKPTQASSSSSASSASPSMLFNVEETSQLDSGVFTSPNKESKINTTILAGIISGIGLVIVIINLGVLFMCRRNLKRFVKNKDASAASSHDDIIQEYFEAFQTMQNHQNHASTIHKNKNLNTLLHSPPMVPHHLQTTSTIKGDSSSILTIPRDQLIQMKLNNGFDESTQLFFNPAMSRDSNLRQSSSAFKPFARDQEHLLTIQKQSFDMQRQLLLAQQLQMQNNQNQYDKINHHSLQVSHSLLKPSNANTMNPKAMIVNCETESGGQYAHTYESLDTLEMPARNQHRGTLVHLGVNGRNYRTVMNMNGAGGHELLLSNQMVNNISPPSDAGINDSTGTTNFNLSTSSSSSSSGTSSTHQLLKSSMINLPQHAQVITINDLNQLNQFLNGNIDLSPDSAYYSSIQNANNNGFVHQQQQQHQNFILANNENTFKSHLV